MALRIALRHPDDVVQARQEVKRFAATLGFGKADLARIEVAIAELATNAMRHAGGGLVEAARGERDGRIGLLVTVADEGPGIADVGRASQAGFSTAGSYGYGLATVNELMDKVTIASGRGAGTRVEVEKWLS